LPLNGQKGSKITPWTSYGQSSNLVVARSTRAGDALFMANINSNEHLIPLLLDRLERISADSALAHKASGIRGALIKYMSSTDGLDIPDKELLISSGFTLLEKAAQEKMR